MKPPVLAKMQENKKAEVSDDTELLIGRQRLTVSNLDKIFWPEERYTKGDLIDYYRKMAPFILPYLKDRPESLLRYPDGIGGISFYHKDLDIAPKWIDKTTIKSADNKKVHYLICQNEATLVYMINLGCIDLNPWSSRVGHLNKPDFMVMDLDPEETGFEKVVETALAVREVLEQDHIPSYPKTSGASGIHIYIPLRAKYTYDQVRDFALTIATKVNDRLPKITSLERHPSDRKGKVYLDCLQNSRGQTLAAPYTVRAKPGATVSTPLDWDEVNENLDPKEFTIENAFNRVEERGDIFRPVLGPGFDLSKVLKK